MESRTEYQGTIRARLTDLEAEIEALMAQGSWFSYDERLTDIRVKQEIAKAKLAELEKAGDKAWQDLKVQVTRVVDEVENELAVVRSD